MPRGKPTAPACEPTPTRSKSAAAPAPPRCAAPAPAPPGGGAPDGSLLPPPFGAQGLVGMPQLALPLALQPFAGVPAQAPSKRCACKKARCLKLYCVCFAAGGWGRGARPPFARRRRSVAFFVLAGTLMRRHHGRRPPPAHMPLHRLLWGGRAQPAAASRARPAAACPGLLRSADPNPACPPAGCQNQGLYCDGCGCEKCQNTDADQALVMRERGKVLARNPASFLPKVRRARRGGSRGAPDAKAMLWGA